MITRFLGLLGVVVLALILLPAAASAKPCNDSVPGGNSEVDQYTETVPGACGNEQPGGSSGGDEDGTPLSPAAVQALSELGADGAAAAQFAQTTSPGGRAADGSNGAGGESTQAPADGPSGGDGSGLAAVVGAVGGSTDDGLGFVFPLVLGLVALAGILYAVARRRGTSA